MGPGGETSTYRADPETPDLSAKIRAFFGQHAEGYRLSRSHRAGSDLERLLQLMEPRSHHRLLDVATAAGHTGLTFAPHVAEVVGLDLTPAMGEAFAREAAERGVSNARFVQGDVHALPFADGSFDLVTCRRAAHHFGDVERAVAEMVRVLRPGGRLGLVDMTAPETSEGATLLNDLERLRDGSHARALDPWTWQHLLRGAGLRILHLEIQEEALTPEAWLYPVPASPDLLRRLDERLAREPEATRRQVVIEEGGRWWLRKRRLVLVAARP
ncbi:MAG: methyltransferase type 11 [Bacillota bacterium]|nr:MAG: methyltransferase type 11 [Bacillota bacterium]